MYLAVPVLCDVIVIFFFEHNQGGVVFIEGLYILMVKFTAAFSLFGNTAVCKSMFNPSVT
jgi:hypothetical protein